MKMRILAGAALAAIGMTMTGCLVNVPGSVVDKSKPIDQGSYAVVGEDVSSTMWDFTILFFPLPSVFPDAKDNQELISNVIDAAPGQILYDYAKGKAPGADALIEYSMDHQLFMFPPFFSFHRTTLTGTPVKTVNK